MNKKQAPPPDQKTGREPVFALIERTKIQKHKHCKTQVLKSKFQEENNTLQLRLIVRQ